VEGDLHKGLMCGGAVIRVGYKRGVRPLEEGAQKGGGFSGTIGAHEGGLSPSSFQSDRGINSLHPKRIFFPGGKTKTNGARLYDMPAHKKKSFLRREESFPRLGPFSSSPRAATLYGANMGEREKKRGGGQNTHAERTALIRGGGGTKNPHVTIHARTTLRPLERGVFWDEERLNNPRGDGGGRRNY